METQIELGKTMDQKILKQALKYDPLTGVFVWRTGPRSGRQGGTRSSQGYIKLRVHGRDYQAHRLAVLYMTGVLPTQDVDHKNHDRADNRWVNLRVVSRKVNGHNRTGANRNNRSGWAGVYCTKRTKWVAQIAHPDGGGRYLGAYNSPEEAHLVYLMAKEVYFGDS